MPLVEYIVPRSEKRILLICALNERVAALTQKLHAINLESFGLYVYRGSDVMHDMLLQTIRRQYTHVLQLDVTNEISHSVYVDTPTLNLPIIETLKDNPAIRIRRNNGHPHIQINVSIANLDLTCMWLAPLLHHGATRL